MSANNTYRPIKIILSGGGTGGHIYPAIAVANKIKKLKPDVEILFVGAQGKMEMTKVPQAGYKIVGLNIAGFQRKLTFANLMFPIKLLLSLFKARKILIDFKPDVVAGFGGYASSPIMIASTRKKINTLIQEQNSYAGVANKAVAPRVNTICVAYEGMDKYFPKAVIMLTGNPVREDFINLPGQKEVGQKYFSLNSELDTVLVLGGSLGARTINEAMIRNMQDWIDAGVQVLWQTGKLYIKEMNKRMAGFDDDNIQLLEFIDRMDLAYAVADIVVSRAGALSISELCLVKKPVIFIPSPNVAEDHQTKNAESLSSRNAALLIRDKDAIKHLVKVTLDLLKDTDRCAELRENIEMMAKPNATSDIANEILKLA